MEANGSMFTNKCVFLRGNLLSLTSPSGGPFLIALTDRSLYRPVGTLKDSLELVTTEVSLPTTQIHADHHDSNFQRVAKLNLTFFFLLLC